MVMVCSYKGASLITCRSPPSMSLTLLGRSNTSISTCVAWNKLNIDSGIMVLHILEPWFIRGIFLPQPRRTWTILQHAWQSCPWTPKICLSSLWLLNRKPDVTSLLCVLWTSCMVFVCGRGIYFYSRRGRPWPWYYSLPYWSWRYTRRLLEFCNWGLLIYNVDAHSIILPSSLITGPLNTRSRKNL